MATGYEKYLTRVGHTNKDSKMSRRLPKPNVCRIEVLDAQARRSYMGGFQQSLDMIRTQMIEAIGQDKYDLYEPFYGILNADSGNGPSFSVTASWRDNNSSSKSGFARMNTILTGGGGKKGLVGLFGAGAANTLKSGLDTIENLAKTGMQLSGVNNTSTGSMTIKSFSNASIAAEIPLKFQWYLPEQEDMCRQSLRRLIMMTYVRPMDLEGYDIVNKMISGFMNAGGQMLSGAKEMLNQTGIGKTFVKAIESFRNNTSSGDQYKESTPNPNRPISTSEQDLNPDGVKASDVITAAKQTIKEVATIGVDTYNSINSFFGGEITANPLPVRVSIGHYIDLEPMIINSVKIHVSNEQFISADGTHLPVFVNADVSVSYWMQPGPTKDFLSILGTEVFEPFINRSNKPTSKNEVDGKIARNNNPSKNKKR